MKILHVPFCYYPDPVGGTEIYVESLSASQRRKGDEIEIAASADNDNSYWHDGFAVHRFRAGTPRLRDMYGEGDPVAAESFGRILDRCRPQIVHLHSWTSGVSLRLLRLTRLRKIPVVFTYHTPTVSCARGTLLRWGSEACEGDLKAAPCAACMLHDKGLSRLLSNMIAKIGPLTGFAENAELTGGLWTALRAPHLVAARIAAFHSLLNEADHIVAPSSWVEDLLRLNHVSPAKLTISRAGLGPAAAKFRRSMRAGSGDEIRIAFLGRATKVKGIDLLLDAMERVADSRLKLDLYCLIQDDEARELVNRISHTCARDPRIRLLPPVPNHAVNSTLIAYDLVAIPSQTYETSPLVALEAFAAGVPLIGSNLGGIAEIVDHERNGLLVESGSVDAWAAALMRVAREPDLLPRLSAATSNIKSIDTVADEMAEIYRSLLERSDSAPGIRRS